MVEKIIINRDICSGCESCIEICPRDCFHLDPKNISVFTSTRCRDCYHCIAICPDAAISHRDIPAEDFPLIADSLHPDYKDPDQSYHFLKSIRSTRKFLDKPIEKEILEKLVDVTRYAPTGHHSQNVEMTLVSDSKTIQELKDVCAETIVSFLKKIDNPFFRFFALLVGKGKTIKKAQKTRHRFVRMYNGFQEGTDYLFHGAPAVFVFHSKKDGTTPEDNCNIAATYLSVLANSYDLGTCFVGYLTYYAKYNPKIRDMLRIPKNNQIYQVLIVGYPAHEFRRFVSRAQPKIYWI
ncbi:MAG: nitroreductase family protein [Candidatus Heimdallarchaeota archaeon]|nr:nitroreductase family protein [Candidatus Heimdallarchaeota archaeon]MBY8993339.1 nitroreductase family protein [Candidatus Heimdallarchaeota archaeon]